MPLLVGSSLAQFENFSSTVQGGNGFGVADTQAYTPLGDGVATRLLCGITSFPEETSCTFVLYEHDKEQAQFVPVLSVSIPNPNAAPQDIVLPEGISINASDTYKGVYYENSGTKTQAFHVAINPAFSAPDGTYVISGNYQEPLNPLYDPEELEESGALYWGLEGDFSQDQIPEPFYFDDLTDVNVNGQYTSDSVTITGIDAPTSIDLQAGGSYNIDDGLFLRDAATIENGQRVRLRVNSSSDYSTTTTTTIVIGGVQGSFSVTTEVEDRTPDAFSFPAVVGADLDAEYISDTAVLLGFNGSLSIRIEGGEYSLSGAEFTSNEGKVSSGDELQVRVRSSNEADAVSRAIITVGDVSVAFEVTTAPPVQPPSFLRGYLGIYPQDPAAGGDTLFVFQGNSMELTLENLVRGFDAVAMPDATVMATITGPDGNAVEGLDANSALLAITAGSNDYALHLPANAAFQVGQIYSLNIVATTAEGSTGQWISRIQVAARTLQLEKRFRSTLRE